MARLGITGNDKSHSMYLDITSGPEAAELN